MADKFWTHDRLAELRERWERGDPSADVATHFGKSVRAVHSATSRYGIRHNKIDRNIKRTRDAKRALILEWLGAESGQINLVEALMCSAVRKPRDKC